MSVECYDNSLRPSRSQRRQVTNSCKTHIHEGSSMGTLRELVPSTEASHIVAFRGTLQKETLPSQLEETLEDEEHIHEA